MPRSRLLKPAFFMNDTLAECSPLARLLFAGLWCHADREGRLEDRPARLRVQILPYDDCNVDELLDELASCSDMDGAPSFLVRYEHGHGKYLQILNFSKHQRPHIKEPDSIIPAPDKVSAGLVQGECKVSASIVQGQDMRLRVKGKGLRVKDTDTDAIPYDEIQKLWNETAASGGCIHSRSLNASLKAAIKARWTECQDMATWRAVFTWMGRSDWHTGRDPAAKGWRAALKFAVRASAWGELVDKALDDRPVKVESRWSEFKEDEE